MNNSDSECPPDKWTEFFAGDGVTNALLVIDLFIFDDYSNLVFVIIRILLIKNKIALAEMIK
jgi:hypothetical protein|tara:strand:- start:225 stop:410 length:186 start_codon:yes stop_codon:yes gene_type:complete